MEMAQVGLKTRAPAALAMEDSAASSATRTQKRRKINDGNHHDLQFSESSFLQLTTHTVVIEADTKSVLPPPEAEESCSSPNSDRFPASCCSSNGSIELNEESTKFLDLEVESAQVETSTCNCGDERKEMSLSYELGSNSQQLESVKEKATEANSRRKASIPTALELEEFFAAAEKEIQKKFSDKYNYDVLKDVPLEGRYEWVQLKP